jgi:hypothetical protein
MLKTQNAGRSCQLKDLLTSYTLLRILDEIRLLSLPSIIPTLADTGPPTIRDLVTPLDRPRQTHPAVRQARLGSRRNRHFQQTEPEESIRQGVIAGSGRGDEVGTRIIRDEQQDSHTRGK